MQRQLAIDTNQRAKVGEDYHDKVLTVEELCEWLQVHSCTIYKLAKCGRLPGFRVGTEWRFRKDAIERWMAEKSMYSALGRRVAHLGRN